MPDELRHIPSGSNGTVQMESLGFGTSASASSYSAALRRQVSLLTADKEADYFLFDNLDRPIRFIINDQMTKAGFRILRTQALSSSPPKTVEAMVEHIIKVMEQKPGLSRARIIAQFTKEYECDITDRLEKLERSHSTSGVTFVESVSKGMATYMSSRVQR
jgi:hypothetical protein